MKNVYRCTLAAAMCLLLAVPVGAQHLQKDIELATGGDESLLQPVRERMPFFNQTIDQLAKKPLIELRTELRKFRKSKAAIYLLTQQLSEIWDALANGGLGAWVGLDRVSFEYDAAGYTTQMLFESWDPMTSMWVPSFRIRPMRDAQHRLIEEVQESWDQNANGGQGAWVPSGRSAYTYNAQGNIVTSTTEFWDEDSGTYMVFFKSTRTYDTSGQTVVQILFESALFGTLEPTSRRSYQYDGNGNTTREMVELYDRNSSMWSNANLYLSTYDGNGAITEDLTQQWDPNAPGKQGAWINAFHTLWLYSPNSADPTDIEETDQLWDALLNGGAGDWANSERWLSSLVTSTSFVDIHQNWDPLATGKQGAWINDTRDMYSFTAEGNPDEFVYQSWDENISDWVNEGRDLFASDENGQLIEDITQSWDGAQWVNQYRISQTFEELMGTANENENPEARFELRANYPNPFNGETTISFSIPETQHVTLDVFDLLGRRVARLVDGLTTPGTHSVTLSGDALAGGLYVYRLDGDHVRSSRTMLLVR